MDIARINECNTHIHTYRNIHIHTHTVIASLVITVSGIVPVMCVRTRRSTRVNKFNCDLFSWCASKNVVSQLYTIGISHLTRSSGWAYHHIPQCTLAQTTAVHHMGCGAGEYDTPPVVLVTTEDVCVSLLCAVVWHSCCIVWSKQK